jgi:hypothetical protein
MGISKNVTSLVVVVMMNDEVKIVIDVEIVAEIMAGTIVVEIIMAEVAEIVAGTCFAVKIDY